MNRLHLFLALAPLQLLRLLGQDEVALKENLDLPYNAVGELDADENEFRARAS